MIEVKNLTYTFSGMIEFKDISKASYDRLLQIVTALNNNEEQSVPTGRSIEIEEQVDIENNGDKDEEEKRPPEPPKKDPKEKKAKEGKKSYSADEVAEKLRRVIEEAMANPDKYEFRFCLARDFIAENKDEFGEYSHIILGKAAEQCNLERKLITKTEDGSPRRLRAYPMKKKSDKNDRIKTDERGHIVLAIDEMKGESQNEVSGDFGEFLKKTRKQVGLSVYELSNLIEYPYYAIQGWESGNAKPSNEAVRVLASKVSPEFKRYLTA